MLAKKTKGRREVTNSCLSCFETLTCILKNSSVLCNTTRCGFVFGYTWHIGNMLCVFACSRALCWRILPYPGRSCTILTTPLKGETSRTPSSRGSGGLLVVRVVTWLQINMVVSQPLSPIISHLCYVTHSHICFQTLFCVFKHWYAFWKTLL